LVTTNCFDFWEWWGNLEDIVRTGKSYEIHAWEPGHPHWKTYIRGQYELARLLSAIGPGGRDVLRRATLGQDVAPLQPVVVVSASGEVREELPFHLRDYLKYDDMFRYGMTPQFVSRFESMVVLNDLGEGDLAKIFVEPEGSIFRTSRDYFKRFGVDLQITRPALIAIAWDASRQKRLGARALREIYRRVIRNIEFDPAAATRDDSHVLTVDEQMVKRAITSREQGSSATRSR